MGHDPHPAERERLRAALARVTDVFVSRNATAEDLAAWAGIVEGYADQLDSAPPESVLWGIGNRGLMAVRGILAPPGFASPPVVAGDAVIAQAFDYLVGLLDWPGAGTVYTSELRVRFLKPVPLQQQLTLEARVEAVDGTARRVSARAILGNTVHATAEAELVVKASTPARKAP
jgi:hypothetical protein